MAGLFIGTSGWNYDEWRSGFYAGVKRRDRLAHYAGCFDTVEVNATFYRLQTTETLERWREETPGDFRFAIKGNRYLTHNKKLNDPAQPIDLERRNARPLGDKLAVVLWQLPGNLEKNLERLRRFCDALRAWDDVRHAIELRHTSWFDNETAECLDAHGIANCQSDAADWPMWPAVTGDLVYIRLHGHTRTYASRYSTAALKRWAASISQWRRAGKTIHVYFDNTAEGAAPNDARKLRELLA
ncbi:MAG: DUF72 domain-containing protein [Gammaproteobacteria bacterium]|nr:DUF72 domain-containing protein [Gammaproteobacteria bacterium]